MAPDGESRVVRQAAEESTLNDDSESLGRVQSTSSRNVKLTLAYTWFYYSGRSLWNQNVLATLVFMLRNGNAESVGYITAVMGLSQLIVAFPVGFLADRYRRDSLLKLGSIAGIVAIIITIFALYRSDYHYLIVSLASWGVTAGIVNTSLSALFADSIPDGERSHYFTQRSILTTLGTTTGPLVALFMFLYLGDTWTVRDCAIVMAVGQFVCLPGILLLCCLTDNDAHNHGPTSETSLREPLLARETPPCEDINLTSTEDPGNRRTHPDDTLHDTQNGLCCSFIPNHRVVPFLVALADVTAGFASGMSIRYFAIFLYDNLLLSPVAVQSLYIVAPILQASLMKISQRLAKDYGFGRCRVAASFKWIGVSLMICMVVAYLKGLPVWAVCTLLVIRTGFMNSVGALTRSVLMDAVPRDERAKWSALESLNMFSWSGSAALGGILVGYRGIIFNFCVTAVLQLVATIPLVLLFPLDKVEGEGERDVLSAPTPSDDGDDSDEGSP